MSNCTVEGCQIETTGECADESNKDCSINPRNTWKHTEFNEDVKYIITRKVIYQMNKMEASLDEVFLITTTLKKCGITSKEAALDALEEEIRS